MRIAWLWRGDKMRFFNTLLQNTTIKLYYLHGPNPWDLCGTYVSQKASCLNSKSGNRRRLQKNEAKNMKHLTDCIDIRRFYVQNHRKKGKKMVGPAGFEPATK